MPSAKEPSRKPTIMVLAATERELAQLSFGLGTRRVSLSAPLQVSGAAYEGKRILLAVSGVGKVNTAFTAALLLERYRPHLLINCGCGGAFPSSGLRVGDLAIASAEVYGDEGVCTAGGWLDLKAMGLPTVNHRGVCCYNEIPLSLQPAELAMQLAAALGIPSRRGRFVTVSSCSGTVARGDELWQRYQPICENMEGAAAAHAAMLLGVPMLEVRCISNMVEDRNLAAWDIERAVETAQRFVLKYIESCTAEMAE